MSKNKIFITLIVMLAFAFIISLATGTMYISPLAILKGGLDEGTTTILKEVRLPRSVLALLVGAAISLSGAMMQTLTKNPLADPYILGVSSGATVGAVLGIIYKLNFFGSMTVSVLAFIGALIAVALVLKLTSKLYFMTSTMIVVVGFSISSFFSAVTSLLSFTSAQGDLFSTIVWSIGSFSGASWVNSIIIAVTLVVVATILLYYHKELDLLLLGDDEARTLGVDSEKMNQIVLYSTTVLIAFTVAQVGVVAFLGLIVPHIARKFVGNKHLYLIPFVIIFGGIFLLFSDIFSRIIFLPKDIPVGLVTAFFGAPFFLFVIYRREGK